MGSILMAVFWMAILVFLYIGLYVANKKTPKPEGCENLEAGCEGCQLYDCTHNPVHHEEEKR
ncbi:MAG TPA: hypothetical protein IAD15_04725 [Candidatus Fimiplasma intestinipullorum]|uniref:FeoB-associated Cys-rich membrane protein n=1 Tax=Candidatus Fimiplasma intestinipullorum TaxID=2840825 RepID=A0A9D1HME6_9FIRM|nr:hypothetical protein [Candidatus Fimiplasma intestinipullorum]